MSEWTDEATARLRVLWDEGYPTAEIGRLLDVSKNAAVGKVHRLGLPPRPSPIKKGPPEPRAPRKRIIPIGAALMPSLESIPPPAKAKPKPMVKAPAPVPYSVFRSCQWIANDPPYINNPPLWCGAPTWGGSSWCGEHHKICIVRIVDRRELPKVKGFGPDDAHVLLPDHPVETESASYFEEPQG